MLHNSSHSRQAGGEERVRREVERRGGKRGGSRGEKERRGGETEEERMDRWTINKQNLSVI